MKKIQIHSFIERLIVKQHFKLTAGKFVVCGDYYQYQNMRNELISELHTSNGTNISKAYKALGIRDRSFRLGKQKVHTVAGNRYCTGKKIWLQVESERQ